LKYTLLGFVDLMQPVSGYDLKLWFEGSVNLYWPATHTQIYRTLNRLLDEGLVQREVVAQKDHPDKKVYSVTEVGLQELAEWLAVPLELPDTRHGLMVQLSFADLLENEQILAVLEDFEMKVSERVNLLKSRQPKYLSHSRSERESFLWNSILDNGLVYYEGELAWVQKTIRAFKEQFMIDE